MNNSSFFFSPFILLRFRLFHFVRCGVKVKISIKCTDRDRHRKKGEIVGLELFFCVFCACVGDLFDLTSIHRQWKIVCCHCYFIYLVMKKFYDRRKKRRSPKILNCLNVDLFAKTLRKSI